MNKHAKRTWRFYMTFSLRKLTAETQELLYLTVKKGI